MEQPEPTRDRILTETTSLFANKGYEATTMKDIADAVGIKAASLYAHYSGKEELFRSVLDSALATWGALVADIFARAESCDTLESGLNAILGDFACSMMGSVAYRFWARIYVFPPAILSPADKTRIGDMDKSFAERLGAFCAERAPSGLPSYDLELFCSSLVFFAMGILMYADFLDQETLRGEIRRGISFHLKAIR